MKRKSFLVALLIIFAVSVSLALSGCTAFSGTKSNDPYEAIKEVYGTEEFTITFNSENLSEPIDDMTYTAYNMPTLPTPSRVGYVFDGWYFDQNYTTVYYEDVLYLYMCDVTLYAKWVKEELVQNGVYDIDVQLAVVDDSITKGSLADKYGNSPEFFLSDVDTDNMQVEKVGDRILFRFSYDIRTGETFGSSEMYSIAVNTSMMGSSIQVAERIVPQSETNRTIYFDISGIDLDDTMYFTVSAYKWDANVDEGENIDNTRISFTLAVTITQFYGLTSLFADTDIALEDGYYSVKSYYQSDMMSAYDAVYSYIYAENGHYFLIKPFTPFTGYVGEDFSTDYYYDISTAMMPAQYYYCIDESGNFSAYKSTEIEFHADTGRYYFIFDLGTDVKQDIAFTFVIGGPMQVTFHMGSSEMILDIDYSTMTKITEVDYSPLSGDFYHYTDSFSAVTTAGLSISDYEYINSYGTSAPYINFFYSAYNEDDSNRKMYSHRITISPDNNITSAEDLHIGTFNMDISIYGYDVKSGENLYVNLFRDSSLGEVSLWGNEQIRSGISLNTGDIVDLEDIFHKKVSANIDYTTVEATAYRMIGDSIDYGSVYDLNSETEFVFDGQSIAVLYQYEIDDENGIVRESGTALIELRSYEAPTVWFINDFSYDSEKTVNIGNVRHIYASQQYAYGSIIPYPNLVYSWYGQEEEFIGTYTSDNDEIHPIYVNNYYLDDNGNYVADNFTLETDSTSFGMTEDHIVIIYELRNCYGEMYYIYIHFETETQEEYAIVRNDEEIVTGRVTYTGGSQNVVSYTEYYSAILKSYSDLEEMLRNKYYFRTEMGDVLMPAVNAEIYTQKSVQTYSDNIEQEILLLLNGTDYAVIIMTYSDGTNNYTIRYVYNMRFNGELSYNAISYDSIFTGRNYLVSKPQITSYDGLVLGTGAISVSYNGEETIEGFTLTENGNDYTIYFSRTGQYSIIYTVLFTYAGDGERVFNREGGRFYGCYIRVVQTVTVENGQGMVTITYVADKDYPFADSSIGNTYTVTYSATDIIYLLSGSSFVVDNGATLYGWATSPNFSLSDNSMILSSGAAISDFISTFNNQNVVLYAVWDEKVTVTLSLLTISGGVESVTQENVVTRLFSATQGVYSITVQEFLTYAENRVPNGYVLIGFTGGFLGDEIVSSDGWSAYTTYLVYETGISYEIYAVYARVHTVRYDTGYRTYSDTYYGNESVVEGGMVGEAKAVMPYEGYAFAGWCVQTAEEIYTTSDIVDLASYEIIEDTTFVALYYNAEGELVW